MNKKKRKSILVVDDERDNISSLKAILNPEYTVYASTNGKDAIETAEEFMPDLVLLDILMPEMDGYDVIAAFKSSEKICDIPVIFITGLDNTSAEIRGLALGAMDYISKPFHPAIIKLRIKNNLQLIERLKQETLLTKIAHNFLANAYTNTLYKDTLRMIGEFMGIAAILLYQIEKNNNMLICHDEWINSDFEIQTRIGDKIELNEQIITTINNLLSGSEKDLCLHSRNPLFKDFIQLNRQNIDNYITTPIFIKGKMCAMLVFSMEDNEREWSRSETDLAVLAASIFSGVFERDAIQHAEYLSRAKSEFLSRMSHEMRTPMNAIIGILQVFNLLGIPENMKEHCNMMKTSAFSLLNLINDVLDISDLEYGSFILSDSFFDFKTMVWDILRDADNNASRKSQLLDCKVDPAIPDMLYGDEKRMKHVITILLSNAVKFTQEHGEISFDARVTDEENGIVTLKIEVTDNGIGISKEQQKNLFSIFEQVDSGLSREYGGIGLGLALSKRIIELMGGSIGVESELGKGSKFWFTCRMKRGG